jgi:hypothetical protein
MIFCDQKDSCRNLFFQQVRVGMVVDIFPAVVKGKQK